MNAKTTAVTLVANGVTQEFEFSHAERLLRMPNNGGWQVSKDSPFEFVDNGLRHRGNTKKSRGK